MTKQTYINIAIDGPAASGKGTIARKIAETMGFSYLDTGMLYRKLAYLLKTKNVDVSDEKAISGLCSTLSFHEYDYTYLKSEEIARFTSQIAINPMIRNNLLNYQKNFANSSNCVIEGRDIGTVIIPDAKVKIFITASVDVRAKRRYEELVSLGLPANLESIISDLAQRDKRDAEREFAPLIIAKDANMVDSSTLSIEEVYTQCLKIINRVYPNLIKI